MRLFCLLFTACLLSGCWISISLSNDDCKQVKNDLIHNGEFGYRQVYASLSGNIKTIGYDNNNIHVPHSACTAAQMNYQGVSTTYAWFEFGKQIERNNIHSIRFYTNANGLTASEATRLERQGAWQQQFVEGTQITRQIWQNQTGIGQITASNNFQGDGIESVIVNSGPLSKTKRFNANTSQYDCTWVSNGVVTNDPGCAQENAFDNSIMGQTIDSLRYLNILKNSTIDYDINEQQLVNDINAYF